MKLTRLRRNSICVWEQRKLSEVVEIGSGMDYKHLGEGDIPVYGTGGYMLSVDKALSEDKDAIGIGRKGTIDKPYILRAPFWTVDTLFYCIPRAGYDLDFTSCLFQNVDWKKKDESTGVPSLSKVIINKIETAAPTYDEQRKIGYYFSNLDHIITLHQCKCYKKCEDTFFAWEQRKLGDVFEEYAEKNHPELPALTIIQGGGTVRRDESDRNIMYDKASLSGYKMVRKDDFILHLRSFEGGLEKATCDGVISPAYHTFHGIEADARFYYAYFRSYDFIKIKLVPHIYGIRDGKSIDVEGMKSIEIPYPSYVEQKRIGDYLEGIDSLITLHQCKCEKIAKSQLNDWEQRKLGEITDRITRKNQDLVSTLPLTISAQYGLIDQNEFFDKRVASKDVSGYFLVNKGEFAYNKSTSSDAPWGAIKRLDRYENGVLSTLYIVFAIKDESQIDSDYLVSYYDTDLWHREVREIAAEGARNHGLLNITPADFFETSLAIPQDVEEQKAIGKYFTELNALITLHQRKCEELQNIKKFMLQNMFAS